MPARFFCNHPGFVRGLALSFGLTALPSVSLASDTCASPPIYQTEDAELDALIERALPVIDRFVSLHQALLSVAPEICLFTRPAEALGYFEPDTRRIAIDARLDEDLKLAILLHEMRHVEQFQRRLCPDLSLSMQNYARAVWAMEADATTVSMIVTWDIARGGDPGPFQALADHPHYSDVAAVFAVTMEETEDIGESSAAAFAAWYGSEIRRDTYYRSSCSAYLDQQDASHLLPQYGRLDPSYFLTLCTLPNGGSFDCAEPVPGPD